MAGLETGSWLACPTPIIVGCYLISELRALNGTKSFSTAVSRYGMCIFRTAVCFQ
jgi:hypothetical protein